MARRFNGKELKKKAETNWNNVGEWIAARIYGDYDGRKWTMFYRFTETVEKSSIFF